MGKEKDKEKTFQCERCGGVSEKKKDVCKPAKVKESKLSEKELKKKPCKK